MKGIQLLKKNVLMAVMCLILSMGAAPMLEAHAETVPTEAVQEMAEAPVENADGAKEDEEVFFFLMMGGGLLIIVFAVVVAMSTFSSSIAVAANMDVDGE